MMLFLYLFLSISLTIAVQLDGVCQNPNQCETSNTQCIDGKCQCNAPSYIPCRTSCVINSRNAYEGESCATPENCIGNTNCVNNKCTCSSGYTANKGLCFKSLNTNCANDAECWSNYCFNSRCTCAVGYEPVNNQIGCQRKLLKIYPNVNDAERNQALCSDSSSCIDIIAQCQSDDNNSTRKYCKCPYGYRIKDNNNDRCEAIISNLFSPLNSSISNYGECGACNDNNAACINAANRITCWCRSGYIKRGDKCERSMRSLVIFPNKEDRDSQNFANNCQYQLNHTDNMNDKLCVCPPAYEFRAKDQPCVKIQREWIDNINQYGLCTRITAEDKAINDGGLCPEPLKCEAHNDKYVCSCGKDQYRDLDDPTRCVYYIGRTHTTDRCPQNSAFNTSSNMCECNLGYRVKDENRQCELILSSELFPSANSLNPSKDRICQSRFGNRAFHYIDGECRCSGDQSFPNNARTHCYAPVNQTLLGLKENCPPNSIITGDLCKCNNGYRPSTDSRSCGRLPLPLVEYRGSLNPNNGFTTEDCQALYDGPVEIYGNDFCQCNSQSFVNNNVTGCWYRLNATLTIPEQSKFCPPYTSTGGGRMCRCDPGFTSRGDQCVALADRVYNDSDPTATSTAGLDDAGCVKLFNNGAIKSTNGDYCICRPSAFPVEGNSKCHFLIDEINHYIKSAATCPANTNVAHPSATNSVCVCKPGYHRSSDRQRCDTTNLPLSGTIDIGSSSTTNCNNYTDADCIAIYGEQAVCRDQKCFCNRRSSFVNAVRKCESFSSFVFPGLHERNYYSCNTQTDCGNKPNVICDYVPNNFQYKVCQCKEGTLLDPKTETCVEQRCSETCNTQSNFECRGYQCVCKSGYYQLGSVCAVIPSTLQLNQLCNLSIPLQSVQISISDSLECNTDCTRVRCKSKYRPEQSSCVEYQLEKDRCGYKESICQGIDENSFCNTNENHCSCKPSFFPHENICVRAVGAVCVNDEECSLEMVCKGQRCDCNPNQHLEDVYDAYGRRMQRCVNNGIDQITFHPVFLLFFLMIQVFL